MTTEEPTISIASHDSHELNDLKTLLLDVYADIYAEKLDDPFFSVARYWDRLTSYASRDGFSLVLGYAGSEPMGYALGYDLPEGSGWWTGLESSVPESELQETGNRTFALTEIMVLAQWRRRGYARALHDALLRIRSEERATLLVLPENTPARQAYLSWGWYKIGDLKPFEDAPTYDSMVRRLPLDYD
jgi:GNAT superfamily N-acetyltransferase